MCDEVWYLVIKLVFVVFEIFIFLLDLLKYDIAHNILLFKLLFYILRDLLLKLIFSLHLHVRRHLQLIPQEIQLFVQWFVRDLLLSVVEINGLVGFRYFRELVSKVGRLVVDFVHFGL